MFENAMSGSLFASGVLADGSAAVVPMAGARLGSTVWAAPAPGDTVTVSYSLDDGAMYKVWPNGAVTAPANDVLLGAITHVKFQRTAGSGTTSTWGITQ